MTKRIVDDVSTLTSISKLALENLVEKCNICICHDVFEEVSVGNDLIDIDIGIGMLYIKLEDGMIKYKFIPSKKLEESVQKTVSNKESPLVGILDTTLKDRIENAYKNLL
jgi:hypothetical protein